MSNNDALRAAAVDFLEALDMIRKRPYSVACQKRLEKCEAKLRAALNATPDTVIGVEALEDTDADLQT